MAGGIRLVESSCPSWLSCSVLAPENWDTKEWTKELECSSKKCAPEYGLSSLVRCLLAPNSAKEMQDRFFHVNLFSCGASSHSDVLSEQLAWRGVQPSVNS